MAAEVIPPPPDANIPPPPDQGAPTSMPAAPTMSGKDIVGRTKEALLPESEAGRLYPGGPRVGPQVLKLVPETIPGAMAAGTAMIPGAGALAAGGRAALAAGGTYAAERVSGREATTPAATSAFESIAGSVFGGLGRAGVRVAKAAWDRTGPRVAEAIASVVPEFGGRTWQETINRVIGGEGLQALRQRYGQTLKRLFKDYGDPDVYLPALAGAKGDAGNIAAGAGPASILMDQMKDLRRTLHTMAGDVSRRKEALQRLDLLEQAQEQLELSLSKTWPPAGREALTTLTSDYRAGMEIQRLFGGGKERLTPAQVKRLIPAEGVVNIPELQANYAARADRLNRALGDAGETLRDALRRGEPNPLVRDVPGQVPHVRWHAGVIPTIYGLPHAPRLAGEGPTPEQVSTAVRALGARGTEAAVEP